MPSVKWTFCIHFFKHFIINNWFKTSGFLNTVPSSFPTILHIKSSPKWDLLKFKTWLCRNLKHAESSKLLNQLAFGFISKDDSKPHGFSTIYIAIQAIKYKKFSFYYILYQLRIENRKLYMVYYSHCYRK